MRNVIFRAVSIMAVVLSGVLCVLCEEPIKVSLCQLRQDPAAYNRKLVQVTAFAISGFEYFELVDPDCPQNKADGVWLEYGGLRKSDAIYCCGHSSGSKRASTLAIDDISIPLILDSNLLAFRSRFSTQTDSSIKATLAGRFFARTKTKESETGYGHFGMYNLLAIQQVVWVDTHKHLGLDQAFVYSGPTSSTDNCYYGRVNSEIYGDALQNQKATEEEGVSWKFSDPRKVATKTLAAMFSLSDVPFGNLKLMKVATGRKVYRWKKDKEYLVVVSRPYWLSHYAATASRVAWQVIGVYENKCN